MKNERFLSRLTIAVKIILLLWLFAKLAAVIIPISSGGKVDLTFIDPGIEVAFSSLIFTGGSSKGLAVFIFYVIAAMLGYPMSFLIVPDSKVQNIIGFFAYMSVTLTDIVSAIVLGFTDKSMILTLVIGALTIAFLLCYGKLCLLGVKMPADPDTAENASSESDGEEEENNP